MTYEEIIADKARQYYNGRSDKNRDHLFNAVADLIRAEQSQPGTHDLHSTGYVSHVFGYRLRESVPYTKYPRRLSGD